MQARVSCTSSFSFDPSANFEEKAVCLCIEANGRGERIRTSDPLVPNQVLYQAEPLPELAVGKDVYELKGPWPSPS